MMRPKNALACRKAAEGRKFGKHPHYVRGWALNEFGRKPWYTLIWRGAWQRCTQSLDLAWPGELMVEVEGGEPVTAYVALYDAIVQIPFRVSDGRLVFELPDGRTVERPQPCCQ
jgi:hypothetical protein